MKKPNGYWTIDRCKKEVLNYKSLKDLKENNSPLFHIILKNKWYFLIDWVKEYGNRYKKLVYVYTFEDNSCYVGITGNIEKRNSEHLSQQKSSVYKKILSSKSIYFMQL